MIMPRRPKKKKRLEPWELKKDETSLRKGRIRKRCVVCREIGHNKTVCPKKLVPPQTQSSPDQSQQPASTPPTDTQVWAPTQSTSAPSAYTQPMPPTQFTHQSSHQK